MQGLLQNPVGNRRAQQGDPLNASTMKDHLLEKVPDMSLLKNSAPRLKSASHLGHGFLKPPSKCGLGSF